MLCLFLDLSAAGKFSSPTRMSKLTSCMYELFLQNNYFKSYHAYELYNCVDICEAKSSTLLGLKLMEVFIHHVQSKCQFNHSCVPAFCHIHEATSIFRHNNSVPVFVYAKLFLRQIIDAYWTGRRFAVL